MTFALRDMTVADLPFVLELGSLEFPTDDRMDSNLADALEAAPATRSRYVLLVAELDGEVVGYCVIEPNTSRLQDHSPKISRSFGQTAVLSHTAVVPKLRGGGLGESLFDEATRRAAMIYEQTVALIRPRFSGFYESRGWRVGKPGQAVVWLEKPSVHDPQIAEMQGEGENDLQSAWAPLQVYAPVPSMAYSVIATTGRLVPPPVAVSISPSANFLTRAEAAFDDYVLNEQLLDRIPKTNQMLIHSRNEIARRDGRFRTLG